MATTVTSTERIVRKDKGRGAGVPPLPPFPPGNGSGGNGGDGAAQRFPDQRYRIGMWVGLAAILMMFTALTSAYIVRAASPNSNDWHPIAMPRVLWLSTALILVSSVTIEMARRFLRRKLKPKYHLWLMVTGLLGLGFLATQLLAWRQLVHQGIYVASNPHSSFFYLFTGAHGIHLLGGILALAYLLLRAWRKPGVGRAASLVEMKRQASADAVTLYWHFMDGLWVYLFLLLFLWR